MTAAAGTIRLKQAAAGVLLADSATFRAWAGAANRAEALLHIHDEALPPPEDGIEHTAAELIDRRPFALLWTDTERGFSWTSGGRGLWLPGGRVMFLLEQNVPDEARADAAEIHTRFVNVIGQIFDDLLALVDADKTGAYLRLNGLELLAGPYRCEHRDVEGQGDHVWAVCGMEHGSR